MLRHPNTKLSKLKNASNSEAQLREQRNQGSNLRRDLSSQFQQQAQLNQAQSSGGMATKSPLLNSRKIFEPPMQVVSKNGAVQQQSSMALMDASPSQQLDLGTMGKANNI